jgi:phosphonate transport system substrate-binding protein
MKGFCVFTYTLLFSAFFFTAPLAWSEEEAKYRFGVVPQFEQRKLYRIWRPILDELEHRTGFSFDLVGSPKIPVFEQKYLVGVYDFVYMNPYHLVMAHDAQGYLPLIRDGERKLKGILVVLKDSPIKRLEELDGKRIVFPSPNALGASLLMRTELAKLHGVEALPHYVQTHTSVYLHVALGLNPAGGGVLSTLRSQKPEIREKLRIVYETRPVNPHPISAHPRIPEERREKVRQALLEMAQTEKGQALLAKIPMGKAVAASLEDYTPMRTWGLEEFYVSGNRSTVSTQHEKRRVNVHD